MKYLPTLLFLIAIIFLACCGETQWTPVVQVPAPPPTPAEVTAKAALAKQTAKVSELESSLGARATTIAEQDARIQEAEKVARAAKATAAVADEVVQNERRERTVLDRQQRDHRTAVVLDWSAGLLALGAVLAGAAWYLVPIGKGTFAGIALVCGALAPVALGLASYVHLIPWLGLAVLLGIVAVLWWQHHGHAQALDQLARHPDLPNLAGLPKRVQTLVSRIRFPNRRVEAAKPTVQP